MSIRKSTRERTSDVLFLNLTRHQTALKTRGIDSMLKEARDDNRENDAEHIRPVRSPRILSSAFTDLGLRNGNRLWGLCLKTEPLTLYTLEL